MTMREVAQEVANSGILSAAVQQAVKRGGRVESQTDTMAVIIKGKKLNHVLHLFLTVVTAGIWIPVWILLAMGGGEKRVMIYIDGAGNVETKKV